MSEDLTAIAGQMDDLLSHFVNGQALGLFLPTEHSAKFKALTIEAKSIIDEELGHANDYSIGLLDVTGPYSRGIQGGPSYASVEEASKIVGAAARAIGRKATKSLMIPPVSSAYVANERIAAIQALGRETWDFTRLVELCRELNVAKANGCHMATAMLLRTILNHIPPVLGFETFAEVANNYGGLKTQKSFKLSMKRLEGSLRNIADMHLHLPIRSREDVPTAIQVDFSADLDVLLGEIIRTCRRESA